MIAKYFVYAQSGVRITGLKRKGGSFTEQIPERIGEFTTADEDFHELGSVFEVDLKNQTIEQLHDLKMLEWSRVVVRLDSSYKNVSLDKIANKEMKIILTNEGALAELTEFYNQFTTKEQKDAYKKKTTPLKIR
jgi:hypothetical protein